MNICLDNNSFPFNIKLFAELRKLLDLNWTDPISEKKHKQTKPNNVITNGKPCIPENRHHNDFRDSFFYINSSTSSTILIIFSIFSISSTKFIQCSHFWQDVLEFFVVV